MAEYDYDFFVIGGGSGGVRAARIAATHGARVGLAEEDRYGGTCVIRGCVPKKLLVYASQFSEHFADATGFGWSLSSEPSFDWAALIANKDKEIDRLEGIYRKNLERVGVELYDSRATVAGPHAVRLVSDGREISAKYILVATGGQANVDLSLDGIEHAITSNEAFHLESLPKRIAIAGGGYIAVEFAGIFNGLGAETTLIYRGEEILRGFDDDLRSHLHAEMEAKGIRVLCGEILTRIERGEGGLLAHTRQGACLEVDQVMFAIGRRPNTEGLGLEEVGVELTERGAIAVDENSRSSVDSIFAVGDVTDRVNLTPVAIREGHAVADSLFSKSPVVVNHELIPTAVFSQPEMGTVGMTEREACARYPNVDIYRSIFRPMRHTLSGREEKMVMKLVVDADSDRVLGVHVLGPDAGELAQVLGIPLKMGATKADFDATMAVHPTAAEELVTMREPAARHRRKSPG